MTENFKVTLMRGFAVWLVIIGAEIVHGILRVLILEPFAGDFRARQIAVFSGIGLILTITILLFRRLKTENKFSLLCVGFFWLVLTVGFEIILGRFVMKVSWERIWSDYDLPNGGLMPFGLIFLTLAPLIAAKFRQRSSKYVQP